MTPRQQALHELFSLLRVAGYAPPPHWASVDPARVLEVWSDDLSPLPDEAILPAGKLWRQQDRYGRWPVPGAILEAARTLVRSQAPTAAEAWGHVLAEASSRGVRYSVPITPLDSAVIEPSPRSFVLHKDQAVAEAMLAGIVAVGGWLAFGAELPYSAEKTFCAAYTGALERGRARQLLPGAKLLTTDEG